MENIKDLLDQIKEFSSTYDNVSEGNATNVISEFLKKADLWKDVILYDNLSNKAAYIFGNALLKASEAISISPSKCEIDKVRSLIDFFRAKEKYKVNITYVLFYYISLGWFNLDSDKYSQEAKEAVKMYLFYLLCQSSNKIYAPTGYSFRTCNEYLFDSLAKDEIYLSSPVEFNDPFDCPIISLLDNEDRFSKLVRDVYIDCIKVRCFVSNYRLPYNKDPNNISSELVKDEKKDIHSTDEYMNELMWAHYADYHKGICIKYRFPYDFTIIGGDKNGEVRYFGDVVYLQDLSSIHKNGMINTRDAFFAKSESWKYENEMRLLYFDFNSTSHHSSIKVPGCIEAVYFGVKCSDENIKKIMDILSTKKLILKEDKNVNESPIEFYRMEYDKTHLGKLKTSRI